MNGSIFLDRKILDWEWYTNINTKIVFIHLLLKANWKDVKWQGQVIKRGQLVTSIPSLCNALALTPREVRTALTHLCSTGEIDRQTANKYSVITVLNYDTYQTSDRQTTAKRQSNDSLTTVNEKDNKDNNNNISCAEEPHESIREQDERDHRNFEKIYALYPKKVGKTNAFIAYKQWISKNGKSIGGKRHHLTPEQIFKAVKKYVEHQTDNGTQMEYWKNFDTLMGRQLLDYVEDKNDTS